MYLLLTCLPVDFGENLPNGRYFTFHNTSERQEVRKVIHLLLGMPVHGSCSFWENSIRTYFLQEALKGSWAPLCSDGFFFSFEDEPEEFLYVFFPVGTSFSHDFFAPHPIRLFSLTSFSDIILSAGHRGSQASGFRIWREAFPSIYF